MMLECHCPNNNWLPSFPLWSASIKLKPSWKLEGFNAISIEKPFSPLLFSLRNSSMGSVYAIPYLLKRMPDSLWVHLTLFEKLKSLGLNPKKSIANKMTTNSPVNHFNEFFFWCVNKSKQLMGKKFYDSNYWEMRCDSNCESESYLCPAVRW